MKKFFLAVISLVVAIPLFADDDRPITVDKMPSAAREFISRHFGGLPVAVAKQEGTFLLKNYDVIFTNGDKVEFDRKGIWTNLDCKYGKVPAAVIPQKIADYIAGQYPGVEVLQIEKEDGRYEVELSNRVDLTFNSSMELIDIDY